MKYDLYLKNTVGGWDFDPDYVDYIVAKNPDKELHVLINSLGGSVDAAMSIAGAFRRHGKVHAHFTGMNASAATIASLGAKRVTIDKNALYLVHKCSVPMLEWGTYNADDLQKKITDLQKQVSDLNKIDLTIASMYADRTIQDTGKEFRVPNDYFELMTRGGWLTAQEALKYGFVDEVTADTTDAVPELTDEIINYMQESDIPMPDNSILHNYKTPEPMQKELAHVGALLNTENNTFEFVDGCYAITDTELQTIEDALAENVQSSVDHRNKVTELSDRISDLSQQVTELTSAKETLTTENDSLKAQVAELEAKLAALPADETTQVVSQETAQDSDDYFDTIARARELYDSVK